MGHIYVSALSPSSILNNFRCAKNKISPLEYNWTPIQASPLYHHTKASRQLVCRLGCKPVCQLIHTVMCLLQIWSYDSESQEYSPTSYLNIALLDPGQVLSCLEAFPDHPSSLRIPIILIVTFLAVNKGYLESLTW